MMRNATSISPTGRSAKPYTMRHDNSTKAANDKDVGDDPKKQQQQQTEKDKQESSSADPHDAAKGGDNDGATTTPAKKDSAGDQDTAAATAATTSPAATENSNNSTAAAATAPVRQRPALFRAQHPQQQQPSGGRIIVLGASGPPQQRQSMMPPQQRSGDGRDEMLVDVLGGLAVRMVRLGILTWLSRHLMHREETIVPSQQFVWEVVNEKHDRDVQALKSTLRRPPHGLRASTWRALKARFQGKPPSRNHNNNNYYNSKNLTLANLYRRTVIVIEMSTYAKASDSANMPLEQLPDIVSFLTSQQVSHAFGTDKTTAEPLELEVILCLASPGGSATLYGKAAAELVRFKQSCPNLSLTVCVDEVAASGGYMMASQADRIVAAPFAIVGSIGVIQEGFNFYELCKRYGVQPLVLKSGESKNPISSYGPISRQDLELEQVRLKKVHRAFQDLVLSARPQLSTRIMDGSIFSGDEAYELGLIDDIQTSEEYIFTRVGNGDRVLRLHRAGRHKNAMRNLSVLDLLPHLQTFIVQMRDPAQAVKAMVRLGTYLTLVRELIQTAHKVLR
jgi:ClpP class serine protease